MRGDHLPRLLWTAVLLSVVVGVTLAAAAIDGSPRAPQRVDVVASPAGPAGGVGTGSAAVRSTLGRSIPVRMDIPAIAVHTPLLSLGLQPDGSVAVPPLDSRDAGWYENSPTPGEVGPAVVLGHVDSARTGPGVFYDLRMLLPGDAIRVTRADGTVAAFRVDHVSRFPKATFPTAAVYGNIDHPGLRLITCGGAFDRAVHSYVDDVVVFASGAA